MGQTKRIPVAPEIHPSGFIEVPDDATDSEILEFVNSQLAANKQTPEQEAIQAAGQSPYGETAPDFMPAFRWVRKNPGDAGAIAAGVAAAPFTGGISAAFPMMAAEGAAAATGALAGNLFSKAVDKENKSTPGEIAVDVLENGLFGFAGAGIGPALKTAGTELYGLALKPRLAMSHTPDDVAKLVDTGLREGINVSRSGFQKAGKLIGQEADEVQKLVARLNSNIPTERGLKNIESLKARWRARGVLDEKIAALDDVAEQYRARFGSEMSPGAAHEAKQGIWHETQNAWDRSLNPAKQEAQKAFGSGLREELEVAGRRQGIDDIGTRNARIGEIGELQDVISGRAVHETIPGLRQGVEMVGGASPGYLMRAVATSSPVLSGTARALHAMGRALDPRTLAPAVNHAITDERRLLGAGAIHLGPGEDPSFVRGVAAPRNPRSVAGNLPEPTTVHPMGPSQPDTSYVRGEAAPRGPFVQKQLPASTTGHRLPGDMSGPIEPTLPENYEQILQEFMREHAPASQALQRTKKEIEALYRRYASQK